MKIKMINKELKRKKKFILSKITIEDFLIKEEFLEESSDFKSLGLFDGFGLYHCPIFYEETDPIHESDTLFRTDIYKKKWGCTCNDCCDEGRDNEKNDLFDLIFALQLADRFMEDKYMSEEDTINYLMKKYNLTKSK